MRVEETVSGSWRRRLRYLVVPILVSLMLGCSSDDSPPQRVSWSVSESSNQVVIDNGAVLLTITLDPFRYDGSAEHRQSFLAQESGLYIVRDGVSLDVATATLSATENESVAFDVTFADGSTGAVDLESNGRADSIKLRLRPHDLTGVSAWGERFASPADELIYGLTERITDDVFDSEIFPAEVGSLNRKGEAVSMWVTPTMSGYVPFHQSSRGYGVLVDGFMPGRYDVGASDPGVVRFEFEWDPDSAHAGYNLFAGPGHTEIVDAYYALTGRPPLPPRHVFRHWRGIDVHPIDTPIDVHGIAINSTAAMDLAIYEEHGVPPGNYRFDRPWTVGDLGFEQWTFDPQRFPNAEEMLAILEQRGWHMHVFTAPWALGRLGDEAEEMGYLAPNSDRGSASVVFGVSVDFTNADAVAWYKGNVLDFLAGPEGRYIDGFVMDRADERDVRSNLDDIWFDGRNGRQIHNWYPVAYARIYREIIDEARPRDGYLLARAGYTGSQAYVMRWGGDTHGRDGFAIPEVEFTPEESPSTDLGLRSVLISVQRAAFMGTPFWGSDIGGYNGWLDREVYARWIQVGFASPLMRFHGRDDSPWNAPPDDTFDQELMDIYRGYIQLRHAMNDYLVAAARQAVESGLPMVRPLVFRWPAEQGARDRWDQWMLGDDLLVAPLWRSGARDRTVWIPPGEWVDFWNRRSIVEGPVEIVASAPLAKLPMWCRPGSPLLDLDIDAALASRLALNG